MSAITETEPGGEMVCILQFSARPRDAENNSTSGERRTFHVGERVRYLSHFSVGTPEDNPIGYMAVFQALDDVDRNHYAAVQSYFVALDCWEGLKDYFISQLAIVERDKLTQA